MVLNLWTVLRCAIWLRRSKVLWYTFTADRLHSGRCFVWLSMIIHWSLPSCYRVVVHSNTVPWLLMLCCLKVECVCVSWLECCIHVMTVISSQFLKSGLFINPCCVNSVQFLFNGSFFLELILVVLGPQKESFWIIAAIFCRPDALPVAKPTVSEYSNYNTNWLKVTSWYFKWVFISVQNVMVPVMIH